MATPVQLPLIGVSAWAGAEPEDEEHREERIRLLAALDRNALVKIEQRVAAVLRDCPDARESDTALAIEYWRTYQSYVLSEWKPFALEALFELDQFESLSRARRRIQNDLKLFQATLRTRRLRSENQLEFLELAIAQRDGKRDPEIRFYLDETGTDQSDSFTGVGGICVIDWRLFEVQHAAMTQWRRQRGWPETLHCAQMKNEDMHRHLALLTQLDQRRAGLLFVGYGTRTRIPKRDVHEALYVHMIKESLLHLAELGCLNAPRALVVVKEKEEGFDQFWLESLKRWLQQDIAAALGDRVYLRDVEPLPKGREVLLECADHIAWAMKRRAACGGRNPKDELAEAVMNVTGFEDPRATGIVYKAHVST